MATAKLFQLFSANLPATLFNIGINKVSTIMLVYPLVDKSEEADPLTMHRLIFYLKQDQAIWAEHHRQALRPLSF